ncbi:hypothetical protein [Flavobacterium sp. HSC-61S13]|uniref:hypothetical protein n=1 Tax=Flavobacterium sp. HSC-61S13 TaxID=2910963 RepID=UPI0020A19B4E|nr:hypothetical protein [Flavobacterium sp. HSC-61S13]MCP1997271.1 hypothetical protein [Flavobacterium sp. HSC-61S13]
MAQLEIPFEYQNETLGVKLKFLVSDENKAHKESLCLIRYNALYKRLKSDTCCERELRRASLGFDALIEFNSLVQEWRDALVFKFGKPKEEIKQSFFAKHYLSDRKAFDFFCAHRFGDDDNKKLDPEVIELYTYNASVLNTVITVKNNRKAYVRALGTTGSIDIWESLSNDVNSYQDVKHDLPTTKDSLRRKVTRYINEGYLSVISGKYGKKNAAKVKEKEQLALLEELLNKHQNLNNEQISDLYNTVAKNLKWKTIEVGVVALKRKEFDLFVFAGQHGETNLMHQKHMQIKRSKPSAAMLYWTMDGWDAELLYQTTTLDKNGNSVTTYTNRLNVVMVLDPFNNYIIGYAIGTNESPALIRQALKNALNHTKELFGTRFKPYQLQTDHYQKKNLQPTYEAVARYFTPAKVKNSKAKVIENFFDKFNERNFQATLTPNWSGHNVTSKTENQVNGDFLTKIRHSFPDEKGCIRQIEMAIENERASRVEAYVQSFIEFPQEDKMEMTINNFLRAFGAVTGFTNKFDGSGLTPKINGIERYYDTFDLTFRKHMHEDWMIRYDPDNLSEILVSNAESSNGKFKKELGTLEFILTEKHIQPMALYDQEKTDSSQRQLVYDYNKRMNEEIINRSITRHETLEGLFDGNPQLDTLRKFMIPDSKGQHKDQKSAQRIQSAQKILISQEKKQHKEQEATWSDSQDQYLKQKVNLSKYLEL